jgi:hypothetical protein
MLPYLCYTLKKEKTIKPDVLGFGRTQSRYDPGMEEFV